MLHSIDARAFLGAVESDRPQDIPLAHPRLIVPELLADRKLRYRMVTHADPTSRPPQVVETPA
jgi:hypothetical protein